jgi:hypothetical protein
LFGRHTDRERQTERERGCSNDIYSQNAASRATDKKQAKKKSTQSKHGTKEA